MGFQKRKKIITAAIIRDRRFKYEGHEEKMGEQDCEGPHGQSNGPPWFQGEDHWWFDCLLFDEEQVRQGREQKVFCQGQEEHLDDCCPEGKEGTEDQRLRRYQEGHRPLQEGKGVLLKMLATASAQGVEISMPFERYSLNCIEPLMNDAHLQPK